ncbi:MAG: helix-turn-helix domain-containing protein [Bacilli bacterium]|nr:helix-turn-helix domain-containing protein [Bacilli bacterium]
MFEGLISLKEAAELFGKDESTLRRNIKNGKFIDGIDCKKFGKQWVFDIKSLEREYGNIIKG